MQIEIREMRMSNTVPIPNEPAAPHQHHLWGGDGYMMNKSVGSASGSRQKSKYMECLKNHAAAIGGSATDGCGEFMPGGVQGSLEALKCEACNCHRNFHRKSILPIQQQPQRKRARTKFSQDQKEKMQRFAEKAEWKIHKVDDAQLRSFCQEIGVNTKVLKVWMHNNKYNNHHLPTNPLP